MTTGRVPRDYEILTCGVCGATVQAVYAVDRMVAILKHWKSAKHDGVPTFDRETWNTRIVVDSI
jgi:hypothetical protein